MKPDSVSAAPIPTVLKAKQRTILRAMLDGTGYVIVVVLIAAWWISMRHGGVAAGSLIDRVGGRPIARAEVLLLARSFAEHHWEAGVANVRHGFDRQGIEIQTPDGGDGSPPGRWQIGGVNTGLPYKWGGFDTPDSFDAGLKAGKAAGDVYSNEKRRRGNAAVSDEAVGIDCSGLISRCWNLPDKLGTAALPGICRVLDSPDDLQPGDIMDAPHGHVLLFEKWLNSAKSRALFYEAEAEPLPKVVASEHSILWLRLCGARPYRYLRIRD